jgi:hypothetical protein
MYELKTFGKEKGYDITYKKLDEIIGKAFPEKKMENDWYQTVAGSRWTKADKDRLYLKLRKYRKGKLRSEEDLGYYDYVKNCYIVTSNRTTVIDVIEKYQKEEK